MIKYSSTDYPEKGSTYLRRSAYQLIDRYPLCDKAFEKARFEDKSGFINILDDRPYVVLSIGTQSVMIQ